MSVAISSCRQRVLSNQGRPWLGLAARIAFIGSRTASGDYILLPETDIELSHPQQSFRVGSREPGLTDHVLSAVTTDVVCSEAAQLAATSSLFCEA